MGQATKQITDATFETDVLKTSGLVLVDFWAEWCGPCKMIGPVLEELGRDMEGKVTIGKVNVDENPASAGNYGVRSIPTLMLFKDGKPVSTKVGALPKQALQAWVQENL
jgi:thioredoxin 1